MRATRRPPMPETVADLLKQLGGISPRRIRLDPLPGTATEKDVIDILDRTNRAYELVDGVLVEKIMGFRESVLACHLVKLLGIFVDDHDLGLVAGADGAMCLMPHLVRIPDVSFIGWHQLPNRELPDKPIPDLAPDLAVEVLNEGNTPKEMKRKLGEYFLAGVKLVWFVDPESRTVEVFTAPDQSRVLPEADTLDGGEVLPGLAIPIKQVFARIPRQPKAGRSRKSKTPPNDKNRPRRNGSKS